MLKGGLATMASTLGFFAGFCSRIMSQLVEQGDTV